MSLQSVLALVDDKLHDVFHRKQPDAKKARQRALKTIETARRQFASQEVIRGRKVWAVSNEVVSFTPGYRITERKTVFVQAAQFGKLLNSLEAAINAGELDEALLADEKQKAETEQVTPTAAEPAPKKRTRDPASTANAMATRAANQVKAGVGTA